MINKYYFRIAFVLLILCGQPGRSQDSVARDPYLWLEEVESDSSLSWVRAHNAISDKVLAANPLFERLRQKYLDASNDKDKIAYPDLVGDYVYNFWQDDVHERGIWRRMPKADFMAQKTEWETVLDIDALSEKEGKIWVFAGATWLAPDNNICLLYLANGGKDENVIREFDARGKTFVEGGFTFPESKGGATWITANKLLVARDFGAGIMTSSGYPRQVKLLERGTATEDASLIFETDSTNVGVFVFSLYDDNKTYTFVSDNQTTFDADIYYLDAGKLQKLKQPHDAQFQGIHKNQALLSLQSDWKVNGITYRKGSLVSYNFTKNLEGSLEIKTIYQPDEKSSYVGTANARDFIVVNALQNVQNKLIRYTWKNDTWQPEALQAPSFGSIRFVSSDTQSDDYFYLYSNFISPRTLYHGDATTMEVTKKLKDVFNTKNLVVEQFSTPSKDGTVIPYFIVHPKDMALNGENPTLITAYGGFNVSMQPDYSYTVGLGWLEQGGVYVLANIRGGGEFGPAWHEAGMKEKKQNDYDDFYAVTEDLIRRKITSPEYLGVYGWSNGGLMAGVVFTQRPDLYSAVVVGAPLLDMKRYNKMLAGASWMGEYGNPDIPAEWAYIKKYSPYHNILAEKEYPEVFFVTSTKDDRVHPGHARKMAAKMEDMGHPFLYQETIEGGHGAASTNAQQASVSASIYTYLNMKLNNKAPKTIEVKSLQD